MVTPMTLRVHISIFFFLQIFKVWLCNSVLLELGWWLRLFKIWLYVRKGNMFIHNYHTIPLKTRCTSISWMWCCILDIHFKLHCDQRSHDQSQIPGSRFVILFLPTYYFVSGSFLYGEMHTEPLKICNNII